MYKKTQTGWFIIIPILFIIFITVLMLTGAGIMQLNGIIFFTFVTYIVPMISILILFVAIILFYNLTIQIDEKYIKISFGIGLIKKQFELDSIVSCKPVKIKWWYGWGIHTFFNTIIYNVAGFDAVELEIKNYNKKVLIGTAEPTIVCAEINQIIQSHS